MLQLATSFGSIRNWQTDDASALAKYANNRRVSINLRDIFPFPYTPDDAHQFLSRVVDQADLMRWAIATPEEAIGGIGLTRGEDIHRRTAELGYWLAEPYWGRGIASESVQVVTNYAFATFDLLRIFAEPFVTNVGSCRVLEKAGFVCEGILRANAVKAGQVHDMAMYALVRDEV